MAEKSISPNFADIPNGLTQEQKQKILDRCNAPGTPPTIKVLCEFIWGPGIDGRDKRSKPIKEFCGSLGKKYRVSYEYQKISDEIEFDEGQQKFIKQNCAGQTPMTATEIARVLFGEPEIGNLDR